METQIPKEQIETWVGILRDIRKGRHAWIQRKEVAAWAALGLYFAILWHLSKVLFDAASSIPSRPDSLLGFICIGILWFVLGCVLWLILWYVFFRFIHSQYNSIYWEYAYTDVVTELASDLGGTKRTTIAGKDTDSWEALESLIEREVNKRLENRVQKFRGRCHPGRIVVFFWFSWLKRVRNWLPKEHGSLTNTEQQEAATYSLLSSATLLVWAYLVYRGCTH